MDFTDLFSGCGWDLLMSGWRIWLPLLLIVVGCVLIFMFDNPIGGLICIGCGVLLGLYFWQRATRHDV